MGLARVAFQKSVIDTGSMGIDPSALARNLTGINLGEAGSLAVPVVLACVRAIAEPLGSLPVDVIEMRGPQRLQRDQHPARRLIHLSPNSLINPSIFRETMTAHLLLWGNAYAGITRFPDGTPAALWPLHPSRVNVVQAGLGLRYETWSEWFGQRVWGVEDMLHIRGLSLDGIKGIGLIGAHRQAIGLAKAGEETAARMFSQGIRASGIIEHPRGLQPRAREALEASFAASYSGLEGMHRPMVLEEGAKWTQVTIPPEDMQFLESRKFQVVEIARIFRVPPHKIGDLERATFSNIEHQALEYVTDTLMPHAVRWEQEIRRKLFAPSERELMVARFRFQGLLRADQRSRNMAYAIGRQWGWLSANDVRALEDESPIDGGDIYLSPSNMVDADTVGDAEKADKQDAADAAKQGSRMASVVERMRLALASLVE